MPKDPHKLTLEELGIGELIENASALRAKKKAAEFAPEAIVTFVLDLECQTCHHQFEAPKFSGNSTFIRGRTSKGHEYRQHYGGFDHLPHEVARETKSVVKCHRCMEGKPNGSGTSTPTSEDITPLERATRQFYASLREPQRAQHRNLAGERTGYSIEQFKADVAEGVNGGFSLGEEIGAEVFRYLQEHQP